MNRAAAFYDELIAPVSFQARDLEAARIAKLNVLDKGLMDVKEASCQLSGDRPSLT